MSHVDASTRHSTQEIDNSIHRRIEHISLFSRSRENVAFAVHRNKDKETYMEQFFTADKS